jgi:DNA-binding response OmpR family regulator
MTSKAYAGSRVLVVEDEVLIGMVLEDILDMLGCTLAGSAATLAEAETFPADAIDIAILDVHLGGESSFGLADALRAGGVAVMFATGAAADTLPERFRSCPVLEKPYAYANVEAALSALVAVPPVAAAN